MVLTQRRMFMQHSLPAILPFPYHYGSYATYTHRLSVSPRSPCFHTTMVLTQHSSLHALFKRVLGFHTTMVLTQHDLAEKKRNDKAASFHTTMVLTQPVFQSNENWRLYLVEFPYHYGSHSTLNVAGKQMKEKVAFPYHYGSHSTDSFRDSFISKH